MQSLSIDWRERGDQNGRQSESEEGQQASQLKESRQQRHVSQITHRIDADFIEKFIKIYSHLVQGAYTFSKVKLKHFLSLFRVCFQAFPVQIWHIYIQYIHFLALY